MTQTGTTSHRRVRRQGLPPTVTLALWRLRQVWRLLLTAGVGMLTAVVLVCIVPLYSQIAMTTGLRSLLTASPDNPKLTVISKANGLSTDIFAQETQQLTGFMQRHLGTYLANTPAQFTLDYEGDDIIPADPAQVNGRLKLLGVDMEETAAHATVLRGRLPLAQSDQLEIALTDESAKDLHVDVGGTLRLDVAYLLQRLGAIMFAEVPVSVVGVMAPAINDPFWNGEDFVPFTNQKPPYTLYSAVMSSATFLALLTQLAASQGAPTIYLFDEPALRWDYRLASTHLSSEQLDDAIETLKAAQITIGEDQTLSANSTIPQLSGAALGTFGGEGILERYRDQVLAARIPVLLLLLQAVGLAFFFLGLMGYLLIERQVETIAMLRSRGASRRHIFGTFLTQALGLGVGVCLLGPLLALLIASLVGRASFPQADRDVLDSVLSDPLHSLLSVGWYALATSAGAVVVMVLTMRGAANRDVLSLRRDLSRASSSSFWQRLNLDVVAALIALIGYGLSLYVANSGALDARVNQLISVPLALVGPIFLLMACVFLVPRFFPWLLQQASRKTARRASASAMLALAQMARAPLQAMRMVVLLALTLAFVLFSLALSASQQQQALNSAAHQVGADFSGVLPQRYPCLASEGLPRQLTCHPSLARQTDDYRALPGVSAASVGFSANAQLVTNAAAVPLKLLAVDSTTFAQTALWTPQEGAPPLADLMAELRAHHTRPDQPIPAIVDARAWEDLHLSVGTTFLLSVSTGAQGATTFGAAFTALAEIQHLPTVNDSLEAGTSDYIPPGGLLVDYLTLAEHYHGISVSFLPRNYVWLRTSDDAAALKMLRTALTSGPLRLSPLYDRRAQIASTQQDPLVLTLLGILSMGAMATMLLALVGNLLASWLNVRKRVVSFAILRAMGSPPRQLVSVLLWEQGIIYSTALVLGVLFGAFLIATTVPALVLTSASRQGITISSGEYYALQHVLPVQIVLPMAWVFVLVGLAVLLALALWLMARVVARPVLSQTLRLSED